MNINNSNRVSEDLYTYLHESEFMKVIELFDIFNKNKKCRNEMYLAKNFALEQFADPFEVKSIIEENKNNVLLVSNSSISEYESYLKDEFAEDQEAMLKMSEVRLSSNELKLLIQKKRAHHAELGIDLAKESSMMINLRKEDSKCLQENSTLVSKDFVLNPKNHTKKNIFSIKAGPTQIAGTDSRKQELSMTLNNMLKCKRNKKATKPKPEEMSCEISRSDEVSEMDDDPALNQGLPPCIAILAKQHKRLKVTLDLLNRYRFYKRFCNSNYKEAFA